MNKLLVLLIFGGGLGFAIYKYDNHVEICEAKCKPHPGVISTRHGCVCKMTEEIRE